MLLLPILILSLLGLGTGCSPAIESLPTISRTSAAERAGAPLIQIGLFPRTARLTLMPEGSFSIENAAMGRPRPIENRREYPLRALDFGEYAVGPYRLRGPARISSSEPQAFIRVGDKAYRGELLIRPNSDATVAVINELGIEEYLYGVLPAEMSPDWPLEALKAQAVVARTFALNNLGKFQSSGFDLSSDSRSQAYGDVGKESMRVIEAVRETRGQVLSWRGRLLQAFFHSCCGGHTDDYRNVWGSGPSPKPLRGVSDRYCRYAPEYRWSAYFTDDDVSAALDRRGYDVVSVKKIRILSRDDAGFVRALRITAKPGDFDVSAKELRDWLGPTDLRSTKIDRVSRKKRGFEFSGRGFGHGVGLCQWGANLMAQRRKSYRQILEHYFPGARLARYHG